MLAARRRGAPDGTTETQSPQLWIAGGNHLLSRTVAGEAELCFDYRLGGGLYH